MPFQVEATPTFGEDCLRAFRTLWEEREACRKMLVTPAERQVWKRTFDRKGELIDSLLDAYNTWRVVEGQ
jgi:hypothetical protein